MRASIGPVTHDPVGLPPVTGDGCNDSTHIPSPTGVRFRLPQWDVQMPEPLVSYWTAWNEMDLERVPQHLAVAVTQAVEWNDPRDSFVGIEELEAAIRRLRVSKPGYRFVIASEIDRHHHRLRYRWDMIHRGRVLMEGLDVVTLDPSAGLICRVDRFFGHPTPSTPTRAVCPTPSAVKSAASECRPSTTPPIWSRGDRRVEKGSAKSSDGHRSQFAPGGALSGCLKRMRRCWGWR